MKLILYYHHYIESLAVLYQLWTDELFACSLGRNFALVPMNLLLMANTVMMELGKGLALGDGLHFWGPHGLVLFSMKCSLSISVFGSIDGTPVYTILH